jgi:hypothetical protein
VDDAVGGRGLGLQHAEVLQVAADDIHSSVVELCRGRCGACEADDLVARVEKLGDDGRPDPSGRASDENAHVAHASWSWSISP